MLSPVAQQRAYLRAARDAIWLCLAFALAFAIRSFVPLPFVEPVEKTLNFQEHFWLLAIAVPLHWALCSLHDRNGRPRPEPRGLLRTVLVPFVYLGMLLGTAIFLFQAKSFSRAVFFMFLGLAFLAIVADRLILERRQRRSTPAEDWRNVLIVGCSEEALAIRHRIEAHTEFRMRVVGHVFGANDEQHPGRPTDILGPLAHLKSIVEEQVVDEVIFVLPPAELIASERQIAWCEEVGITVHVKVNFVRTLLSRTYPTDLDGIAMLTLASIPRDPLALLVKRGVDIVGSLGGLALLSPLMLGAALAVRFTSRGPVIFSQERVGLNGRPFRLYKFRSMYRNAEERIDEVRSKNEMSGPVFKMKRDPRVTLVGRALRKFSIDELPQLWNVLRGHMSLVGPRPPIPEEVRRYERWQRRRLSMKPGLTCLWQVNGRNQIHFEDWMKLDLEYIDTWCLSLDLKILMRTVPAVVLARGAR